MVQRSPSGKMRHLANKAKTRNSARSRKNAEKRPAFTAAMPKGLSKSQQEAWERATSKANGDIWKPEKQGDTISGTLVSTEEIKSKFGPQRVLTLKQDKTLHRVYCKTVLEREYLRVQPKIGDELIIVFLGVVSTGKGRPAQLYGLSVVEKPKRG